MSNSKADQPDRSTKQPVVAAKAITLNSLTLGLFAIVSVGLIALTYVITKPQIDAQVRAFETKALREILADALYDNDPSESRLTIPPSQQLATTTTTTGYVALKDGQPVAVVLSAVAPDGYSGKIDLLVGIFSDGSLAGVRVVQHRETPGLGDKIDTRVSDWILQFQGRSLTNPPKRGWAVKKDGGLFDQFTGATVTPRAVVAAVQRTLVYFQSHRERLFEQAVNPVDGGEGRE